MVYTGDLKSPAERHTGSSPVSRTIVLTTVVQWLEQGTHNALVAGSIPACRTRIST